MKFNKLSNRMSYKSNEELLLPKENFCDLCENKVTKLKKCEDCYERKLCSDCLKKEKLCKSCNVQYERFCNALHNLV